MNVLKRYKKITVLFLSLLIATNIGVLNVSVMTANASSEDDFFDFMNSVGGYSVTANAVPDKSPFAVFGEAFNTDNPVEGATKTARAILGAEVERHVENVYDTALGKEVFKVEVNGSDCYTCYLHNTSYNSATGQFTGGNDDRQRIEIRPADTSTELIGLENDITGYNWKLKIDKELTKPDGFFHIFQYKAYNSLGKGVQNLALHDKENFPDFSSSEDGNPILTFTVSSSATQNLEFRYADIGTDAGQETLASIPLNAIKDKWLDITIKILNSEYGWVTMSMKDVETGEILLEYNDPDRVLDIWRRPEIKYNGQTFEGPYPAIDNMLNRPKWGIYRKADKSNPNVKDAKIYLADMTLFKSSERFSPVNLAYNKNAYNVGATNGNAFQLANAKADRLTDGVQMDPVKYTNLTVPQNDMSALGDLTWIGTESSKKGNVIIDLGKKMDFNQVKLFAKSLRLKYVNVSVSDDDATYTEADLDQITFTAVDPLYTDGGKDWTFFNAANGGGDDAANKEYLVDLGKTYSSRYVKFYFENGSGSNTTNDSSTYTMTGPPRISQLEIYNAPQTPKNITMNYSGGTEATIAWDSVPADYFVIYDNGKAMVENITSNEYTLTNLDPGALYNLSVRTVYTDPYSFKPMLSAESEVQVLQTEGDSIIPNPPASVTATAASNKSIDVIWDEVPDAQSYRVALVTDAYERIVADDYKGIFYTIKDLSPGTSYAVKVYSIRRGTPSTNAAEGQVTTSGIKNASDNLLFNKEVQYTRVWNDDASSYGANKALDNDVDGSRWVALKGSTSAWMMVDIGEITPVSTFEYYSYQNKLKKVSFYYATDGEAFTNPDSDKWIKAFTDDRVASNKYGDSSITKIEEKITLDMPVNARFIKFSIDEVDGDINVNEVKAFGPMSFVGKSALTAIDKTDTSVELSWEGSDTTMPVSSYEVYVGAAKLATVSADVYNYSATTLTPNTEYTFRIKAVSEAVSEAVSDSVYSTLGGLTLNVTTLPATTVDPGPTDPGSSNPGTFSPDTTNPASDSEVVRLDLHKDATVTQETAADGSIVTKVTIKGDQLALAAAGKKIVEIVADYDGNGIDIELPGGALLVTGGLTTIRVEANGIFYELPLSVLQGLQKDDIVGIHIGTVTGERLHEVNQAITSGQSEPLLPSPIEFRLTVAGQEVNDFNGIYVERRVGLQHPADTNQTTAVWIDDNNRLHFVPSVVNTVNGSSEIIIRSPHNSIYTVIQSKKSFDDLQGHWARADVELLANKWIVNGQSENNYNPEMSVTRAEFAAMLIRSIGLPENKLSSFIDVPSNSWFAGAVGTAQSYGLITGLGDGTFRPQDKITREQMAIMTVRALKVGGKELFAGPNGNVTFTDYNDISEWSREAVGQLATANLIQGMTDETFAPQQETTRAQAATMLNRVLKYLGFIN